MHSYERVTSHIIAATTGRYPVDSKALRAYLRYGNKKVSFIGLFHRSLFTYVKRCWSFRSSFAMEALRAYLRYGIALVSFIGLFLNMLVFSVFFCHGSSPRVPQIWHCIGLFHRSLLHVSICRMSSLLIHSDSKALRAYLRYGNK